MSTSGGMTGSQPGWYGYNHRARIIGPGDVDGTYYVDLPMIAPNGRSGPFPAVIPGLVAGDRVLMSQIGMTRGDLVIVGKLPGDFPTITEVPGLSAALAAKANESDLTTLTTRVGTDETTIAANGTAITANSSAITTLQGRATTDETAITANGAAVTALQSRATTDEASITANAATLVTLAGGQRDSYGNDYDINHDLLSSLPRALASSSITLPNGIGLYAKFSARQALTLNLIKFSLATAGIGGTLAVSLWHGPTVTALTYVGTHSATLGAGRQDWTGIGASIAANDLVVVGFLALAMSTQPALAASPAVSSTLLNQDATVLTSVETTATLTALPTSALNMGTLTGYTLLGQIPWLAASP